jgi:hypothetical protein
LICSSSSCTASAPGNPQRTGLGWADRPTDADRRALTRLFWTHVNLYGRFTLDMDSQLDLTHPPQQPRPPGLPPVTPTRALGPPACCQASPSPSSPDERQPVLELAELEQPLHGGRSRASATWSLALATSVRAVDSGGHRALRRAA